MTNSEMIKDMIDRTKLKLQYHQEEYFKTLTNETISVGKNATHTNVENMITFLARLNSNISKCLGKLEELEFLYTYISIQEKNQQENTDDL